MIFLGKEDLVSCFKHSVNYALLEAILYLHWVIICLKNYQIAENQGLWRAFSDQTRIIHKLWEAKLDQIFAQDRTNKHVDALFIKDSAQIHLRL